MHNLTPEPPVVFVCIHASICDQTTNVKHCAKSGCKVQQPGYEGMYTAAPPQTGQSIESQQLRCSLQA